MKIEEKKLVLFNSSISKPRRNSYYDETHFDHFLRPKIFLFYMNEYKKEKKLTRSNINTIIEFLNILLNQNNTLRFSYKNFKNFTKENQYYKCYRVYIENNYFKKIILNFTEIYNVVK